VGPCDLAEVVHDVVEELGLVYGPRFQVHGPPSVPGYWSGEDLRRVVENLCTNAIKYGAGGEPVLVTLERRDGWVALEVRNALAGGQPLSADELSAAFELFHRTPSAQASAHKGWGLGLTLVKGIAEAHGGTVRARSTREDGTAFTVLLPVDARAHPGPGLPH
jgi:signal transduction histidine kinase